MKMIAETNMITDVRVINHLAKSYNTLDYAPRLKQLLMEAYPTLSFEDYTKFELHEFLNDALLSNYHGEEILKYKLFKKYLSDKSIVAAFEIKVNNSRADFLTINGHTRSFEIKSELDNLTKLNKQAGDYLLAFEYNYVVTDERHIDKAKDLVPESFGLWTYKNGKYKEQQRATLNDKMDPEVQLRLLTKKERIAGFALDGEINGILGCYDISFLNEQFKKILKARYKRRWDFLVKNESLILPIDIQFFFNANISPSYIYA